MSDKPQHPCHKQEIPRLNRIIGQLEGIKKMIEEHICNLAWRSLLLRQRTETKNSVSSKSFLTALKAE